MISISKDGVWYYEDTPIERKNLIRLFYSALCHEGDTFEIRTPIETVPVIVEDKPYHIKSVYRGGEGFIAHLNDDTSIPINAQHPLTLKNENTLILLVRDTLEASFSHNAYMTVASALEVDSDGNYTIESFGKQTVKHIISE